MKSNKYSTEEIQKYEQMFNYDQKSGVVIRIKTTGHKSKAGDRVGYNDGRGYLRVKIDGKLHYLHRIVWQIANGPIPEGMLVDHIDGNRSNNQLSNLRLVNSEDNRKNVRKYKTTESGVFGVRKTPEGKWNVRIKSKGRHFHLGNYESLKEATMVRKEAEEVFGFHSNHGRK